MPETVIATAVTEQRESGKRLGEILIAQKHITTQQLQAAVAISKSGQDTLFSHFFQTTLKPNARERFRQLLTEGLIFVILTLSVMMGLGGIPQGGLISVFLVSTGLTSRLDGIIESGSTAREGFDLLALFLGLCAGYGLIALLMTMPSPERMFSVIISSAGIDSSATLLDRHFHYFWPIVGNNLLVLFSACVLAFCFRNYGMLLTLAWNASLWGLSLVVLTKQSISPRV